MDVGDGMACPKLIVGDFNTVFHTDHRINGAEVSEAEIRDGCECIKHLGLAFIKSSGHLYSLPKGREAELQKCTTIDHALGNSLWMDRYSDVSAHYLNPNIFDNCPILVRVCESEVAGARTFKFSNYM